MEATVLPRARCNPAWFTSLMLKKRVAALDGEVRADYVTAAKQSVLDYILLEVREVVVTRATNEGKVPEDYTKFYNHGEGSVG